MLVSNWLRTPQIRRGLAMASVVLAFGGLVLYRAPDSAALVPVPAEFDASTGAKFSGPGAHGSVALSHARVLANGGTQDVYAEVRMTADKDLANARAPLALAVVLDTSGSMSGDKIEEAKSAVMQLVKDMRDDDQIAIVRYSDDATIIQHLARVGDVRNDVLAHIRQIEAGGGTAIPLGLSSGLNALGLVGADRVQRIVLVSDGLDSTRAQAESLAQSSFATGITISSMGIGLDFDESYMSGVARAGHGNFGFVKDASALTTFLHRELDETATTTVQNATVRIQLPHGVQFVSASGADATMVDADVVELKMGALFAGDERRAIVHLTARIDASAVKRFDGTASWVAFSKSKLNDGRVSAQYSGLTLAGTTDMAAVESGIDHGVYADAMSVVASERELKAAEAYSKGDTVTAQALIDKNIVDLKEAVRGAPAPRAAALGNQMKAYGGTKEKFNAAPGSDEGKTAAKKAFEQDNNNLDRLGF